VNPLHSVSQLEVKRGRKICKGSIYAITDYNNVVDPNFGTEENIISYTRKAQECGLVPMFDLVLRHVGYGCHLVNEHGNWFKEYDVNKNMDDVIDFCYVIPDDEEVRKNFGKIYESRILPIWKDEIFPFWKEYIKRMIQLGFQGARIDAIRYLPATIQKNIYD